MKAENGMKRCPKCGTTKTVEHYHRSWGTNDGFQVWCKDCMAEYQRTSAGQRRERNRAKHLAGKDGQE